MSNDETGEKIRLLLFTSPTCFACPEVERVVEQVAGTTMKDILHITKIDITEEPEYAEQYNVMSLPMLIMNDEVISTGLITEDDIKDKLWGQVLPMMVSQDKQSRRKESMMILTKNTISSIISQEIVRKTIGDYCHISVYQQVILSLLALDPLVPQLLYQSGRELGIYGAYPYYLTVLNPNVQAVNPEERFQEVLIALSRLYSHNSNVPLYLATHCDIASIDGYKATLRIYDLATVAGVINVGEPLCHFTAGEIAGTIEAMIGSATSVVETKCKGLGDPYCEFDIEVFPGKEPGKAPYKTKELAEEDRTIKFLGNLPKSEYRKQLFYELIHETSQRGYDSILMTQALRPNDIDYVHISTLQQQIMSLKFRDRFCGALLYSAGRELGVIGPGKEIIYEILEEETLPIDSLKKAVEILHRYLTHPTNYLKREYSFVEIHEGEDEDEMYIRIYENAYAAGADLSVDGKGETLCDFTSGYIAGRLALMLKDPPVVTETKCHGTGSKYCEFRIEKGYSYNEEEI